MPVPDDNNGDFILQVAQEVSTRWNNNEYINEKCLGLCLKSALDCRGQPTSYLEETKDEMIANHVKT